MEIDYIPTPKQRRIAEIGLIIILVIGSVLVAPDILHICSVL